jgi:hypothetical protein
VAGIAHVSGGKFIDAGSTKGRSVDRKPANWDLKGEKLFSRGREFLVKSKSQLPLQSLK